MSTSTLVLRGLVGCQLASVYWESALSVVHDSAFFEKMYGGDYFSFFLESGFRFN
jgi:hypothetical protein